jgi:aspartyl protease family protein
MFGLNNDQLMQLLFLGALLAFVLGGVGFRRGLRGAGFHHLLVWALILLGLVTVYAYRAPLLRFAEPVLAELNLSRAVAVAGGSGARELLIRRAPDGHFHVDADANGVAVRFLVDTGASSTILTLADAERSGIEIAALEFDRPVQTANGVAFYARASLRTLEIGPYRLTGLTVGVMPGEALNTSLLGMNTINRFTSWRIEGNRMVLVP